MTKRAGVDARPDRRHILPEQPPLPSFSGIDVGHGDPMGRHPTGDPFEQDEETLHPPGLNRGNAEPMHGVQDQGDARAPRGPAAEDTGFRAVSMHDDRFEAAQQPNQLDKRQQIADGVNATAKRRHDDGLDAGQPAGFFGQQAAGTGQKDGTKPRSIQMRHDIQSNFLGATQFELGDDVADRVHDALRRIDVEHPAR